MGKKLFINLLLLFIFSTGTTQTIYFTRTGKIEFHAGTSLEDIDAVNNEVTSVLDIQKATVAFQVLIKSFHFRRALMEEHFNENYMESNTHPKASFTGKIADPANIKFKETGVYTATVIGDLTIRGVTKKVSTSATFTVKDNKITGKCSFTVLTENYNIKIPGVVADKISPQVKIDVLCVYEPRY